MEVTTLMSESGKNKVTKKSDMSERYNMRIRMKEVMEEVDTFGNLGVDFATKGRMNAKLSHELME